MRRFELVVKEMETAKLTVAADRITLKIPTAMDFVEREKIEALAHKIDAELPPVLFTVRGRFWKGRISLSDKSCSTVREWLY